MIQSKAFRSTALRIPAMLLCLAMIVSMAGCSANSEANTVTEYMKDAWEAVYYPYGITQAYHYHFEGRETIENQAGTTLKEAFKLSSDKVPANGHIFYFIRNTDYQYYVLMDENGNVLSKVDMHKDSAGSEYNLDLALRMMLLARIGICAALAPEATHREPNRWHRLTEKQLKKLC